MHCESDRIEKLNIRYIIILHLAFLFYSTSGVLAKYASAQEFLSFNFIILYGAQLAVLFLYSVIWQFMLSRFPLSFAYMNRGIVTVWGLLWGFLLFNEGFSIPKIIASLLIIAGTIVIGNENE